ncbi:MAG: MFS transporter, partial [Candidatus Binatia bacterium]
DLGLLLGPVGLGAVATRFGFEAAFVVGGAFTLATLVCGIRVPETLRAPRRGAAIAPATD